MLHYFRLVQGEQLSEMERWPVPRVTVYGDVVFTEHVRRARICLCSTFQLPSVNNAVVFSPVRLMTYIDPTLGSSLQEVFFVLQCEILM